MTMGMAITTITMADTGGLVRLFSWLSPAFPIGGFAYSQGLETAISEGSVRSAEALCAWIAGQLHRGALRTDAYFIAIAARAVGNGDRDGFDAAAQLCLALQISAERDKETREQARSFLDAAAAWPVETPDWLSSAFSAPLPLPPAIGAMVGLHAIPLAPALAGFANAAISQQISVGVRLIPLGQTAGLAVQARLEPQVEALAAQALSATLNDIWGLSYGTDIASLRHEDLKVRIFRS